MPPKKKADKPEATIDDSKQAAASAHRPSIADMWGRPSQSGGNNLAAPILQITRDNQNWLATGILSSREIAQAKRMLAKEMSRHGRLNMEQLVFQAGHLARSERGFSLELYAKIAGVEVRKMQGFDRFYNQFAPGTPPSQQQAPTQ